MDKPRFAEGKFQGDPEVSKANQVEAIRVRIESILAENPGINGKIMALAAIDEALPELEEIGNETSLTYFKDWAAELQAKLPDKSPV